MFSSPFKKKQGSASKRGKADKSSTPQKNLFASTYGTTSTTANNGATGVKRKEDQSPSQGLQHPPKHPRQKEQLSGSKNQEGLQTPSFAAATTSATMAPPADYEEQIASYKAQITQEKAGKRKLFHSLVKLAGELKRVREEAVPLQEHADYANRAWYEGGLWRAPRVLPGVQQQRGIRTRLRNAVSLSDLFFNLVIVTAFTRVGVSIASGDDGEDEYGTASVTGLTWSTFLYFALFWTIWSKEASYSTRFDTTDLSAKAETLVTCFAVLFGSLSVTSPVKSDGGTRIMMMAAFCAILHFSLYARVYFWNWNNPDTTLSTAGNAEAVLQSHVHRYAAFQMIMNLLEAITWTTGFLVVPEASSQRYTVFAVGVLLSLRIPRAFLANDFHAACTKRGVLFILLLGFLLQSVVVVATTFFEYETPNWEQYSFIGSACLMLFCIKLLYVDDSSTLASDHALLVNRTAALCFNLGQFVLLLSTTVMGSGLNLLTHSYLAAAAALPDHAKNMVCGGFAMTILSTMFIKSMHLKRVPVDPGHRNLFIGAYIVQTIMTMVIVVVAIAMCFGGGGYLRVLMNEDVQLLWTLSAFAVLLVILSWLDEGLELTLIGQKGEEASQSEYLVHPFGFWWCLTAEVTMDEFEDTQQDVETSPGVHKGSHPRLSVLSPLLGESIANMKDLGYDATDMSFRGSLRT